MGKGPEQTLLQGGHTDMKKCSTSLASREMQIKTTMRYHFTMVRKAIINKSTNIKSWQGCREKGTLLPCWWECRLVHPLWKTVWNFLKKLKMKLPFDPAIPLWDYTFGIPKYNSKEFMYPHIHSSAMYNNQDLETG